MIKIFVINLMHAPDRRESIALQLAKQNIKFEFFPAVDGKVDTIYKKSHYRNFNRLLRYARPLSDSQIGCFASHYSLWQKCVELNQPIVVLEDDIYLREDFVDKVDFCLTRIAQYHYIRFMGAFPRPTQEIEPGIKCYLKAPTGTQGYMLDTFSAKQLLKFAKQWVEPVDNYMDKFWVHGLRPYVLEPEIVYTQHVFASSIINTNKTRKIFKITRELYKLYNVVYRKLFLLLKK